MRTVKRMLRSWLSSSETGEASLKLSLMQWLLGALIGVVTAMTIFYSRVSVVPALAADVAQLQIKEVKLSTENEDIKVTLGKLEVGQRDVIKKQDEMYKMIFSLLSSKP